MEAFHWNPCFVTGLDEVDAQHHALVDVINRFGELLSKDDGASAAEIESVFSELAEYARYHFSEEEAMMESVRLDPRYVETHRQSHAKFLEEVVALHHLTNGSNAAKAKSLLSFLTHWLAYHILGSDQHMARQIALVKSGVSPQDAYASRVSSNDPATDTLLAALNGLFQEVSDRNHELQKLNRTLEARVAERTQELTRANVLLGELANTDVLTGLPNRRYAMRFFEEAWVAAVSKNQPLSCLMMDADGFKKVNDSYGHDAGDEVLRMLARKLADTVRTDDVVCRLGGDEFLIICVGTGLQDAMKLGEKIRKQVADMRVAVGAGIWAGSLSIGVAARNESIQGIEDLIKAADEGVYASKDNGRNCVSSTQPLEIGERQPRH